MSWAVNFLSCGTFGYNKYEENMLEVNTSRAGITHMVQLDDFNGGPGITYNERLLPSFGMSPNTDSYTNKDLYFFKMLGKSRQAKKPVLLILIEDPSDESQIDVLVRSLIERN